jgi:hypothetical protein
MTKISNSKLPTMESSSFCLDSLDFGICLGFGNWDLEFLGGIGGKDG